MKLLRVLLIVSLLPTLTFAQRGGGAREGGGGFRGGGGGGGARSFSSGGARIGGGFSAGHVGNGFSGARVGGGYGGARIGSGFYGGRGYGYGRYGYGYRGFYGGGLYLGLGGWPYYGYGYGYPYYGYGYGYPYSDYGYGYSDPYYSAPYDYGPVTYSQPAPQQQPVVIQQTIPQTSSGSNGSFYRTPDFYLIAFSDHTIRAAVSYDVQGDQIHWVDREHEEHRAPLTTVDRGFSAQINRDRRVEFRLPYRGAVPLDRGRRPRRPCFDPNPAPGGPARTGASALLTSSPRARLCRPGSRSVAEFALASPRTPPVL
jgi:hypothetical protein